MANKICSTIVIIFIVLGTIMILMITAAILEFIADPHRLHQYGFLLFNFKPRTKWKKKN